MLMAECFRRGAASRKIGDLIPIVPLEVGSLIGTLAKAPKSNEKAPGVGFGPTPKRQGPAIQRSKLVFGMRRQMQIGL